MYGLPRENARDDLYARAAEPADAASGYFGIRVFDRDDHSANARAQDGIDTRRGLPGMSARLQSDVQGRAAGIGRTESLYLGVRSTEGPMRTLGDAAPITDQNSPHHRVGFDLSLAPPGFGQGQAHETLVVLPYRSHSVFAMRSRIPFTNFEESASP